MIVVFSTVLGFLVIAVQAAFAFNAMNDLSFGLPTFVRNAMILLVVFFECAKPLLSFFICYSEDYWVRFFAFSLLVFLSFSSVYATHLTLNIASENQISKIDKITLANLDLEQKAYLTAVSKGVISATNENLESIRERRKSIISKEYTSIKYWAVSISILTEMVIIACFGIASFFRKSQNDFKKGIKCNNHEIQYDTGENLNPPQITKLIKATGIRHDKAKLVIDYFTNLQKKDSM